MLVQVFTQRRADSTKLQKTSNYGTQGLCALTEVFGVGQRGAMGDLVCRSVVAP